MYIIAIVFLYCACICVFVCEWARERQCVCARSSARVPIFARVCVHVHVCMRAYVCVKTPLRGCSVAFKASACKAFFVFEFTCLCVTRLSKETKLPRVGGTRYFSVYFEESVPGFFEGVPLIPGSWKDTCRKDNLHGEGVFFRSACFAPASAPHFCPCVIYVYIYICTHTIFVIGILNKSLVFVRLYLTPKTFLKLPRADITH